MRNKKIIFAIAASAVALNAILILLFLAPSFRFLRKKPTPAPKAKQSIPSPTPREKLALFSLLPQSLTVETGERFTLQVNLSSKFPLSGADAVLKYDPKLLAVEKIESGELFSLYPRAVFDNDKGRAIITGIETTSKPTQSFKEEKFALVTFLPLLSGKTQLSFDFQYNSTKGSTAVRSSDQKNILSHTQNATVTIK